MKKFSFVVVILVSILVDHAAAFSRFDKPKQWATPRGNSAANRSVTAISASPLEVIEPSYNLAVGSLALGAAFGLPGSPLKSTLSAFIGGIPLLLFGIFLAFQTTTLRFTFDDKDFSTSNLT